MDWSASLSVSGPLMSPLLAWRFRSLHILNILNRGALPVLLKNVVIQIEVFVVISHFCFLLALSNLIITYLLKSSITYAAFLLQYLLF